MPCEAERWEGDAMSGLYGDSNIGGHISPDRWDDDHEDAYRALLKLVLSGRLDDAVRVVATALGPAIETSHLVLRGLTRSGAMPCFARLLGKRCKGLHRGGAYADPWEDREGKQRDPCTDGPSHDHARMLNSAGKPAVFVSQPYGMSLDAMRELVRFCDTFGLEAHVDACGWYFYGRALRVEIAPRGGKGTHYTVADCNRSDSVRPEELQEAIRAAYSGRRGHGKGAPRT